MTGTGTTRAPTPTPPVTWTTGSFETRLPVSLARCGPAIAHAFPGRAPAPPRTPRRTGPPLGVLVTTGRLRPKAAVTHGSLVHSNGDAMDSG
ncbi:unnamed protein product [[Actinomadura] parvosata subsp. kistnae]|nr:unnamed protein product [Actinomadura parvosata subsp. kistnae]